MKINSLSRLMLAGVLLVSFNASAVSGLWQQGYGQGNAEYSVTDSSGRCLPSTARKIRTRTVFTSNRFF